MKFTKKNSWSPFCGQKSTNLVNSSETCLIFNQKHQFGDFKSNLAIFIQKSANLSIFSAKNRQFNTFLKTRTRTRLTGFLKIKTRNPLFQNPTPVLTSLIVSKDLPNCWPTLANHFSVTKYYFMDGQT